MMDGQNVLSVLKKIFDNNFVLKILLTLRSNFGAIFFDVPGLKSAKFA